ncbi:carbamoyl-phosphate synthase protein [Gracilaria domingensis]|nr:carbamoyl-phosphate synthase protein [Gracilaria domingensis]
MNRFGFVGWFLYPMTHLSHDRCQSPEHFEMVMNDSVSHALFNFIVSANARPGNVAVITRLGGIAGGLIIQAAATDYICFACIRLLNNDIDIWMEHLSQWAQESHVIVHPSGRFLTALLFRCAAVVSTKEVHVAEVKKKEDIFLIQASKSIGLSITCDVNVLDLYGTENSGRISREEQEAL